MTTAELRACFREAAGRQPARARVADLQDARKSSVGTSSGTQILSAEMSQSLALFEDGGEPEDVGLGFNEDFAARLEARLHPTSTMQIETAK